MESDKDRKLRLRLQAVRNDPQGWIDCGDYLEKFDPDTNHVFRRKKPKVSQTPHQDRFKSLKRGLER